MHPLIYLNKTMVEANQGASGAGFFQQCFTVAAFLPRSQSTIPNLSFGQNTGKRLAAHAEKSDVDLAGCTEKNVGEGLGKLVAVNQVKQGRARVILLGRTGRRVGKQKIGR